MVGNGGGNRVSRIARQIEGFQICSVAWLLLIEPEEQILFDSGVGN